MNTASTLWRFFVTTFKNEFAAAGFMGNLFNDSAFDPKHGFDFIDIDRMTFVNDGKGYGLCHWTNPSEKHELHTIAEEMRLPMSSLEVQIELLKRDFEKEENEDFVGCMEWAINVEKATRLVYSLYEKVVNDELDRVRDSIESRINLAKFYYNCFAEGVGQEKYVLKKAAATSGRKVKIRKTPSFLGKRVVTAPKDALFKVLSVSKNNQWYRVCYRDELGWVRARCCTLC